MQTIDTVLETMQADSARVTQSRTSYGHLPFSELWIGAVTPKAITRLYFSFGMVGLPLRKMVLDLCALCVVAVMTLAAWSVMTQGWLTLAAPIAPMMTGALTALIALLFTICAAATLTRGAMTLATWFGTYLRLTGQGPAAISVRRDGQANQLFDVLNTLRAAH